MIKEGLSCPLDPERLYFFHVEHKTFFIVCFTAGTSELFLGRRAGEVTPFLDPRGN